MPGRAVVTMLRALLDYPVHIVLCVPGELIRSAFVTMRKSSSSTSYNKRDFSLVHLPRVIPTKRELATPLSFPERWCPRHTHTTPFSRDLPTLLTRQLPPAPRSTPLPQTPAHLSPANSTAAGSPHRLRRAHQRRSHDIPAAFELNLPRLCPNAASPPLLPFLTVNLVLDALYTHCKPQHPRSRRIRTSTVRY
ncbi:hypothetical protein R3P38DRAFT_3237613 [Favolaschia claudopus]|uniref:Uncharacterized protein n=1 Tax=Favolaschia claudopus TaxID=2862362 RepID=A0AAV9ZAN0_9AGAR